MSKALQEKIKELFDATKDLKSLEKIKPHCDRFNEWVNQQNYSEKSLGTLFSRYGLYSKFRKLLLKEGENAALVVKYDAEGNPKGQELKHYVPLLCGLKKEQWNDRNHSTRAIDRLENSTEVDPDTYLQVTGKLLNSDDPHELAVGIVAATGRRPHEVLARGKFSSVEGKPYHVMFSGQGKKRGENPIFEIATLYPADFVIKCLARLRRDPSTKALLKEVAAEFPDSITQQNVAIGNKRNKSLLRVVATYFGSNNDNTPVLKVRHGDEQGNNKALRAAYAVLATERDCQGSFGAKILHASRLLGHFVKQIKDDRDLVSLGTSAGYSDYFVSKPVSFPSIPEKEKPVQVRVSHADYEEIRKLQDFWKLPNQQSVVSRLIERQEKNMELGRLLQEKSQLLQEAKEKINKLENQLRDMKQDKAIPAVEPTVETAVEPVIEPTDLESRMERMIEAKLAQALARLTKGDGAITTPKPELQPVPKPEKPSVDWEGKSNAELWATKAQGSAVEKIRRVYNAICLYNDTIATGDNDRLAITNQGLRELSGVNGLVVGEWIKAHADEIITHHNKYGMGNAKDPSKVETYYNKRHGQEKVGKLMALVNEKFLDGVARS